MSGTGPNVTRGYVVVMIVLIAVGALTIFLTVAFPDIMTDPLSPPLVLDVSIGCCPGGSTAIDAVGVA